MAEVVLSLVLLACLVLAILQMVSGKQHKEEVQPLSKEALEIKPVQVQIEGVARKADNKRKKNGKPRKKHRKIKKKCKNGRKCNTLGKKMKTKNNKRKRKKNTKGQKKNGASIQRNNHCDITKLQDAAKDFRKFGNNLRQLKRFKTNCNVIAKKANKSANGEFSASGSADGTTGSDDPDVVTLGNELKNCSQTAPAICDNTMGADVGDACTNTSRNDECITALEGWLNAYSLTESTSCLNAPNDATDSFCTCVSALVAPPAHCFGSHIKKMDNAVKAQKKQCTSADTNGSFGSCRKKQIMTSEKCKRGMGAPTITTMSAGKKKILRKRLLKKWNQL